MHDNREKCGICEYYQKKTNKYGECRIRSPIAIPRADCVSSIWPVVQEDSWCGEFVLGVYGIPLEEDK